MNSSPEDLGTLHLHGRWMQLSTHCSFYTASMGELHRSCRVEPKRWTQIDASFGPWIPSSVTIFSYVPQTWLAFGGADLSRMVTNIYKSILFQVGSSKTIVFACWFATMKSFSRFELSKTPVFWCCGFVQNLSLLESLIYVSVFVQTKLTCQRWTDRLRR